MIDIHTHILPGVDDGARTMEETLEIIKKAAEEGVRVMVATPHVLDGPGRDSLRQFCNVFKKLEERLVSEKIPVRIVLGAENFITPDLARKIKEHTELTINNMCNYILLELPIQEVPLFTAQTIYELLLQGVTPIISHPERNIEVQKDTRILHDLVKKGALTQINSGSLTGKYGRRVQKTARTLLAQNLVHTIGSDVHSLSNGSYPLRDGVNIAARILGAKRAMEMVTLVPEQIISGEVIEVPAPRHMGESPLLNLSPVQRICRSLWTR